MGQSISLDLSKISKRSVNMLTLYFVRLLLLLGLMGCGEIDIKMAWGEIQPVGNLMCCIGYLLYSQITPTLMTFKGGECRPGHSFPLTEPLVDCSIHRIVCFALLCFGVKSKDICLAGETKTLGGNERAS